VIGSSTPRRSGDGSGAITLAAAGLIPIAAAALLVAARDEVESGNLALLLVLTVVIGAVIGGWAGGLVSAVTAVLAYDFFLTEPYLSMGIDDGDDREAAVVLFVVGLAVGALVTLVRRDRRAVTRARDEISRLHRVAELVVSGAGADDLVRAVENELEALLELEDCTYETPPFGSSFARLERNGGIDPPAGRLVGAEAALPADGVELAVVGGGRTLGRFVLEPRPGMIVALDRRVVAVALADQLGAALSPAAAGEPGPAGRTDRPAPAAVVDPS
jgi:hypothetical protein